MTNTPEARTETGELKDVAGTPAEAPKPEAGAPEAYAEFTAPEGATLDKETIEAAAPIFKELNLSQEQAQKLVDFYAERSGKLNESLSKSVEDMRAEWRKEVMADKDIGGKIDQVKVELGRAKDRLPPDVRKAFDEAMDLTGLGDHPAVIKGIYAFAQLVNEGSHVSGAKPSVHGQDKSGTAAPKTLAAAMYPNLPQ